MRDARIDKLARTLVRFSTAVQSGDNVLIQATDADRELVKALVAEVYRAGGRPFVWLRNAEIERALLLGCTQEQLDLRARADAMVMEQMQAYIGLTGIVNRAEHSDVPAEKQNLFAARYTQSVHGQLRIPKTRWVVLRDATPAMAQMAEMSTEAFEDFYFDVCTMDYSRMEAAMAPLKALMERTDRVHILGPGTDLTFSIKGMPAVPCAGRVNIPDGEIYTSPVKDSVNGHITYNVPSPYDGFLFRDVYLEFRDGKIVKATSNNTDYMNEILDIDEGARYIGEFAFGVNPEINHPIGDILFDEKIAGSFHLTPGNSYDNASNGNHSAVHWDLIQIQTPEYGGGEIWFDDVLIRKDGLFVLDELKCLNPENLLSSEE